MTFVTLACLWLAAGMALTLVLGGIGRKQGSPIMHRERLIEARRRQHQRDPRFPFNSKG